MYFRDVFYCGIPEPEAASKLLVSLKKLLSLPDLDETQLVKHLQGIFEENGYHSLFGVTQGHYGPYVWRETIPAGYRVELPEGTTEYTVNILKGFVFRSWMDYLTFGMHGTSGWASQDGTLNCVEQAYDFESDLFCVSFLKHEAQHASDMKRFPEITAPKLEYRAKLVELIYSSDTGLLREFLSEADAHREGNGHAIASSRLKREYSDPNQTELTAIQTRAWDLYHLHTEEMKKKYC